MSTSTASQHSALVQVGWCKKSSAFRCTLCLSVLAAHSPLLYSSAAQLEETLMICDSALQPGCVECVQTHDASLTNGPLAC